MSNSPPFQSQSTKGLSPFDLHTYSALRRILSTSQGFAFINQQKPFNDALAYCRDNFHDLASIHNDEEFSNVASICPDDYGCWIGGTDATAEGVWTWTDGSEWDYQKWKVGEPNNFGFDPLIEGSGEHHLQIDANGFNDYTGSSPLRFICSGDPCTATSNPSDNGSDGNFYCVNGNIMGTSGNGVAGTCYCRCNIGFGDPNCATCEAGYSGTTCAADDCVATSTPTDDGSDGNFYCVNGGEIGGSVGSCSCTSCNTGFDGVNCANPHHVDDMEGLFNTISNAKGDVSIEHTTTGNYIMPNNDTVILAVRAYRCSEGICAKGYDNYMLYTEDLHGEMKCVQDYASCVLDGESANKGMFVAGTGDAKFTLRAISFFNGVGTNTGGGGMVISGGAIVDLVLCHFTKCISKNAILGGGAILVLGVETTVNTFGVSFLDNEATISSGNDITNNLSNPGSITLHKTCPPPYQSNNSTQGKFTKIFSEALRY